jgi:hypothetical protein
MDGTNDGSPSSKLHTRLRLWEFPDCYIFEPIDGLADLFLSVSRANGTMNLVEALPPRGSSTPKVQTVYGVIGVLKLAVGSYFLVITDRDCVGSYLGHAIFKVTGLKVLPCNNALTTTSAEQKKMESEFSELLDAAERTIGLHFSYDINLTLSLIFVCSNPVHRGYMILVMSINHFPFGDRLNQDFYGTVTCWNL